jgi:pyridoxal 5-phosphate dependent beta-lyase
MAAADVVFVESAQAALAALLAAWRLPAGSRVACLPGEYAPTRPAARRGPDVEPLPVDGDGRADVDGARARLLATDPPRVVHLTHVASHRGVVQPAADVVALCRAHGVPLVLDAAQSLGHVDVDLGADVVYSTSRKWLAGPRGVGVLCVRPAVAAQLRPVLARPGRPAAAAGAGERRGARGRPGRAGARRRGAPGAGPQRVRERLAALGRAGRRCSTAPRAGGWSSRSTSRRPPRRCARPTASTSSPPARGCSPSTASSPPRRCRERAPGR